MAATMSSDWAFEPVVWQDHIMAYFNKKLAMGAFALRDDTLMGSPGTTVNYPYFKAIGDAQSPAEDEGLEVDNLSDDSFQCAVAEIGKAVGAKDKALKTSAASQERVFSEVQRQIARVLAEKVDADIITELNSSGNYQTGFTGTSNTNDAHAFNVRNFNKMLVTAFGDRSDESKVVFIHSQNELSLLNDSTAGFLQANALDPMFGVPGFRGRLLGNAVVVTDQLPDGGTVDSRGSNYVFACKESAYGIIMKQDLNPEQDRDILAREWVWTATMWYGVKSFNAKVAANDYKVARGLFLHLS